MTGTGNAICIMLYVWSVNIKLHRDRGIASHRYFVFNIEIYFCGTNTNATGIGQGKIPTSGVYQVKVQSSKLKCCIICNYYKCSVLDIR